MDQEQPHQVSQEPLQMPDPIPFWLVLDEELDEPTIFSDQVGGYPQDLPDAQEPTLH